MKTITVHKAQTTGDQVIEDVVIRIESPFPNHGSIDEVRSRFDDEAELLMRGLQSLPGGTFDALLVRMLEKKRSHFVVAWP